MVATANEKLQNVQCLLNHPNILVFFLPYGESSSSRMEGYAPPVWGVMLLPYGESSRMEGCARKPRSPRMKDHLPPLWRVVVESHI